jgi:multicomponent Na+:H+ antiporter subunit F
VKTVKWAIGMGILVAIIGLILIRPFPIFFYTDRAQMGFAARTLYILILAACLCLYRVLRGPTAADRIVAIDILGILIVGLCAVLTVSTGRTWYIDIGIAWALQSFIASLALAKYLEGRSFDD